MARLWTCGFETQSTTAGVEFTSATGTVSVSTTVARTGGAALRCNPTAATGYIEHQVDTAAVVKRTFHRVYLRITTLPSATTTILAVGQSGYFPVRLRLTTTGTLQLRDGLSGTDVGSPSAPLTLNTWYRLEIDAADSGSTATTRAVTAYLDGTPFSGTTAIAGSSGYSRVRIGVQDACTADLHFDDVAVNDTNGSAQTSLPGPGHVVHLHPNAAGDNTGFATTVGGTSNWGRVSEATPDDATTYNATTASGTTTIDDFNLQPSSDAGIGSSDTITLVAVGARIGSTATTAASLVYRLKSQSSGTVTESASVSVAVNGWASHKAAAPFVHQLVSYTDPQTGSPWTPSRLDTAQIGYRTDVSQTTVRRVSTLWLLVEYVPSTASTGTPMAELTDDFNAGTVDFGRWPDTYNEDPSGPDPDQSGGQARVPCAAGYFAAFASAAIYTLDSSYAHVRVYPPVVGGATGSVFCQLLVLSSTVGTQIVFEIDVSSNLLMMAVHVDYTDENPAVVPYNPTEHAWLRIREAGGTLYWETSADGRAWTTQHTEEAPAWVYDPDLQAQLLAYRDDGASDYAYFDDFNITPTLTAGYTVAVDWTGDGTFTGAYDDVTNDVLARGPVVFEYGRDQDRQLAPPKVGQLTMLLCNADRVYSPENVESPLVNDLQPAAPVKVETVVQDTLYPLFTGRIDDFEVHPDRGDRSADITAVSLLALLQGTKVSTELYQAQRTGTLMHVILDAVGWTGPRDVDLGATFVPWWWLEESDAFTAVTDLLASEGPPSIAYVAGDGTFIFRDRHHRLLRSASLEPQATFTADRAPVCAPGGGGGGGGQDCDGFGECGFGEGGFGG
jgi:hypothetical protein